MAMMKQALEEEHQGREQLQQQLGQARASRRQPAGKGAAVQQRPPAAAAVNRVAATKRRRANQRGKLEPARCRPPPPRRRRRSRSWRSRKRKIRSKPTSLTRSSSSWTNSPAATSFRRPKNSARQPACKLPRPRRQRRHRPRGADAAGGPGQPRGKCPARGKFQIAGHQFQRS